MFNMSRLDMIKHKNSRKCLCIIKCVCRVASQPNKVKTVAAECEKYSLYGVIMEVFDGS